MNASTEGTVDTRRLIFPALGGFYESIAPYSYAIIRFCAGAIVIYHGYMKLFAGFAGPVVQMAIVTYWHAGNGYFFSSLRGGWEFPLLLTILYAAIFFRGAGRCAVDRMIGKEF